MKYFFKNIYEVKCYLVNNNYYFDRIIFLNLGLKY